MSPLTLCQKQIAELAALGLSNDEIAIELDVTPAVVRAELEALYRAPGDGERADGDDRRVNDVIDAVRWREGT